LAQWGNKGYLFCLDEEEWPYIISNLIALFSKD